MLAALTTARDNLQVVLVEPLSLLVPGVTDVSTIFFVRQLKKGEWICRTHPWLRCL